MRVNSTDLQNNFGKYLTLAQQEDIIITRNGTEMAKLTALDHKKPKEQELIHENAPMYGYGKQATYEEFLQLQQESDERYEYIDGEIYLLASPRTAHQKAVGELYVCLYNFLQGTDCTPMIAPYDIELRRTPEQVNMVQPDLMVICDLEENLDDNDYYKGVPSLIVEVLSKGTRRKDLIKKLDLYMSCGVKEYWIVNPENKEVTVYHFEDQNIDNFTTYKNDEIVQSYIFAELTVELQRIFR
ncbi:type II toxin-antitoxin system prevent-host-death family antitoxin [Bacillus sp. B15-48]|uniref:type II toxin-antitoxin system prevent-host-death family antitoxin n=1 Tax=Bacillus sp. B15-48 TaxID=1548601 RepID=UPI00193F7751|nr:type II toxin-antitoxin system prevent-host-death family antitoxin [Bacillus sp. B15-48]MBM4764750.1 type II toxin-antitoxin system prevent-host-death family antitoxin [Bacillus sp. B15-48]